MRDTGKRLLLLLAIAGLALLCGCFKDKGGAGSESVLNLTPQQQLHAIIQEINERNVLNDENAVRQQIQALERAMPTASGETKYRIIYYLTFLRAYFAELLARRPARDVKAGLDLCRFAQKDVDNFRKANYKPEEHRFLTGLIQSARLEFEPAAEKRLEAFRSARLNLLSLLKKGSDFETEFKIGDAPLGRSDVMLALARTYRRFNDPFRAWETLDALGRKFPLHAKSPLAKIERAYLRFQVGDTDGALAALAEFKGRQFARDLFYDEGLWMLQGLYALLAKADPKRALDEKTIKNLLKESGSFYAKGAGPLEKYIPIRERAYREYGQALSEYFDGRATDALARLYDLVDDAKAKKNEFTRLEAQPATLELSHYLIAKCLEETRTAGPDEIRAQLEAAGVYADTAEIDFKELDKVDSEIGGGAAGGTAETKFGSPGLDLQKILSAATAEVEAKPAVPPPGGVDPATQLQMPVPVRPGL